MRSRTRGTRRRIRRPGFTLILLALLSALLQVSCSSTGTPPEAPQKPRRFLVGVVKGVYGKDFVIFKRTANWMPAVGKPLQWRPRDGDGKGGSLERSPERRGTLFVADIRSGSPAVGDLIYFHEIPGTPDEVTETIGTVPDADEQAETVVEAHVDPATGSELPAADLPALRLPPEERPAPASPAPGNDSPAPDGNSTPPPAASGLPPLRPPPD